MPALVAGIHPLQQPDKQDVDARAKPAHDVRLKLSLQPHVIFMGIAPRKSRLPSSTPHWRRIA